METVNTKLIVSRLMKENNWTKQDLFNFTGAARTTIDRWLKGTSKITLEQLQILTAKSNEKETNRIPVSVVSDDVESYRSGEQDGDFFFECNDKRCQATMHKLRSDNDKLKDRVMELQDELLKLKK